MRAARMNRLEGALKTNEDTLARERAAQSRDVAKREPAATERDREGGGESCARARYSRGFSLARGW